jgi:hypothetical protein
MADRMRNDIRSVNDRDMKDEEAYGNDIQVTTIVEVSHQDEESLSIIGKGGANSMNTSEGDLVHLVQKI